MYRQGSLVSGKYDSINSSSPSWTGLPALHQDPRGRVNPLPGPRQSYFNRPLYSGQTGRTNSRTKRGSTKSDKALYLHPVFDPRETRLTGGINFFNDPKYWDNDSGSEFYPSSEYSYRNPYDNSSSGWNQSPAPTAHNSTANSYLTVCHDPSDLVNNWRIQERSFYPLPSVPEGQNDQLASTPSTSSQQPTLLQTDEEKIRLQKKQKAQRCCISLTVITIASLVVLAVTAGVVIGMKKKTDPADIDPTPIPEPYEIKMAFLGETTFIPFTIPHPPESSGGFSKLLITRDGYGDFAAFNLTGNSNATFTLPRMLVDVQSGSDACIVTLRFLNFLCQDSGKYKVVATNKNGQEMVSSVRVNVFNRPSIPILRIPDKIAEGRTNQNPFCKVSSLGYPPLKFAWVLKRPDNKDALFPDSLRDDNIRKNDSACDSTGSSTLNAQKYVGWNNSRLCCQLKTADTEEVYFETCQQVLAVPADYCTADDSIKAYPYESCFTYVTCVNSTVYFSSCPAQTGFCIDLTANTCSRLQSGFTPPAPPIVDPYLCSGDTPPYLPLPDTFPDKCHMFQRCVGDRSVNVSCDPKLEFVQHVQDTADGQERVLCAPPSELTHCGRMFLSLNVTVVDMRASTTHIGRHASLSCHMKDVSKLTTVTFLDVRKHEVATFNVTAMTQVAADNRYIITGRQAGEGRLKEVFVDLRIQNVTCADEGTYTCVAGDGVHQDRMSASLQITYKPQKPELEIPTDLVEGRSTGAPVCRAPFLGYNPAMSIEWMLRRPDGQQEVFTPSRSTMNFSTINCNTVGISSLDPQGYASWNGSELCCRLVATAESAARVPTVPETCQKLFLMPAVELSPSQPLAVITQSVVLTCLARDASNNTSVTVYHEGRPIGWYNSTSPTGPAAGSSILTEASFVNDTLTVNLTLNNVGCSDRGRYTFVVTDDGFSASETVTMTVTRPPSTPMLSVPDAAEGHTALNPKCNVTSLGFNPVMTVAWVLRKPDGSEQQLSSIYRVNTESPDCDSNLNSPATVDALRYRGWNDSDLCCQVRHPSTSVIVHEDCQHLLLVPEGYCESQEHYRIHPYEPCAKYIQCSGKVVFTSKCRSNTCFNIQKIMCE